jgi:hypothetical protein
MACVDKKTKNEIEEKQTKTTTKNSCDCGCIPPPIKK